MIKRKNLKEAAAAPNSYFNNYAIHNKFNNYAIHTTTKIILLLSAAVTN